MNFNVLNGISVLDNYILFIIRKYIQNKYLDKVMWLMTTMGNGGAIWVLISIILILNVQYREVGNITLLTLLLSTIISEGIIKHIVKRIRPCNNENNFNLLISKPISYSFPSGHTVSSFAVASVLSSYFVQYSLIFMGIASLIALSRIYLHVHYPSDIIAGILIGVLCSKLIFLTL
ncbi:MAG: phosphatase PAP2 family protein [Clostridium sp.]|nr:phosphatase PAP2 family protein [Clostridium sp.]